MSRRDYERITAMMGWWTTEEMLQSNFEDINQIKQVLLAQHRTAVHGCSKDKQNDIEKKMKLELEPDLHKSTDSRVPLI